VPNAKTGVLPASHWHFPNNPAEPAHIATQLATAYSPNYYEKLPVSP
jgi:hypothetical protein